MYRVVPDLRVVELAAFIAAPSATLYLRELGADVVRIDPIGGGPDYRRWPLAPNGHSLYWEGLNKGKRSIAIDLARPAGRELAAALITAPGPGAGLFVTNTPPKGWLAHDELAARRRDLISLRVMGWPDGRPAVDYTINAATGFPLMTGPVDAEGPVNHVLPAWDLLTGSMAAMNLLAAERRRRMTGEGAEIRLPLSDIAFATLARLGHVGEVTLSGEDRARSGNDLFGAFGCDFATRDGARIMLIGLTAKQWQGLLAVLVIAAEIGRLETELGADFSNDEGGRFTHRARLKPIFAAAIARHSLAEISSLLERSGATWSVYRTVKQALAAEPGLSAANPVFDLVTHPSATPYLTPGASATHVGATRESVPPAPCLGAQTDEILSTCLDLPAHEIARLHDQGLVAGP